MVAKIKETMVPEIEKAHSNRSYDPHAPGMDDIRLVMAMARHERREYKPKDLVVGSFGIVESDGNEILLNWSVSGYRKDKRHGAVDPGLSSKYGRSLFESMFKGW